MLKDILFPGLLILIGGLVCCSTKNSSENIAQNLSVQDVEIRSVKTTNADIAIANLNSQIVSLEKLVSPMDPTSQNKNNSAFKSQLLDLIQTQIIYIGSFDNFYKARKLTLETDNDVSQILINITYHMMVHEYDEANQLIDELKLMAGTEDTVADLKASLYLARGENLDQAEQIMQNLINIEPNYGNHLRLAGIQRELGLYNESLKSFSKSIQVYNNTSPFPPAYTHFQVGLIYGEYLDAPELAKKHYQLALKYVPYYAKARVHLAEIFMSQNNYRGALNLIDPIKDSQDPEVPAILAKIHSLLNNEIEAQSFKDLAALRYQTLLQDFELAFADHGAEFFMGIGDNPVYALELAQKNLANRKSDRAYDLVDRAQIAVQNLEQ